MDSQKRVRMQDILVVASESTQRQHLTSFLKTLSPRVRTCASMSAAQSYLCDTVPDSVVAECHFPGGTVAELKALLPNHSDLIVLSTDATAEEAFLLAQLGINYFLSNPVDYQQLYHCLEAIQHRQAEYQPVFIQSFGGLRIFLGDAELVFPKKPPYRLLTLIKLIISLGGIQVPVNKICDAMWEADDGDTAINKFYTSVHRLRKMLGSHSLIQSNNKISFNSACVDLDTWRLKRYVEGNYRPTEDLSIFSQTWLPEDDSAWLETPRKNYTQQALAFMQNLNQPDYLPTHFRSRL